MILIYSKIIEGPDSTLIILMMQMTKDRKPPICNPTPPYPYTKKGTIIKTQTFQHSSNYTITFTKKKC